MAKRVLLVAIILAAILVVAAPALAFNGYRENYQTSDVCQGCHDVAYSEWADTPHAVAGAEGQAKRMPYGSSCAGCHTANYDPSKAHPTPTATVTAKPSPSIQTPSPAPTATTVSWGVSNWDPADTTGGDAVASELAVGCSSCHYNMSSAHAAGVANPSNLANAEICGQCHSRYSYSTDTHVVETLPYVKIDGNGSPIPNPSPTSLVQPQYALGMQTMGNAGNGYTPEPLADRLNIQTPGWVPTPNPAATTAAGLQTYWQIDGVDTVWQYKGHDGSASQYPEWANEGHANALENLKAVMGPNPPASCLKCHSADYMIADETAKPTGAEAKYGITCVGCHTPHERGTATGVWSEEWSPQLRTDSVKTLCVECHNASLDGGVATPGSTVHHPMKEMMNGTGAIGVPQGSPSVHKGKCVQCHMPPTSTSPTGANHTFKIIEPEVAREAKSVTLTTAAMPFSACTTCHSRPNDTPAMWLQDTLDDRQEAMARWDEQVGVALDDAALVLGYSSIEGANTAINAKPMADWTAKEMAFQKAFTNRSYVVAEGSMGIHNWDYARTVILKALEQAQSVTPDPWVVSFTAVPASVKKNASVKFAGAITDASGGTATIEKMNGGLWKTWQTVTVSSTGTFSKSVKMTAKGTFFFRATYPGNLTHLAGASAQVKVTVK